AEAERILNLIKRDNYVTPFSVKVCYRMASVDLPRARAIADKLATANNGTRESAQKAHAYGVMAMALAEKDPTTAKALLRQAFDQLASFSGRDTRTAWPVAAVLLGYSEAVDPERTREYFWRTLALHPGPIAESWSPNERIARTHENNSQL